MNYTKISLQQCFQLLSTTTCRGLFLPSSFVVQFLCLSLHFCSPSSSFHGRKWVCWMMQYCCHSLWQVIAANPCKHISVRLCCCHHALFGPLSISAQLISSRKASYKSYRYSSTFVHINGFCYVLLSSCIGGTVIAPYWSNEHSVM